jgi:hypothetical protein
MLNGIKSSTTKRGKMPKVKLACKSCGKVVEREEKPEPKNKKEAKQIRFNCPCGATNYRDGSAEITKKSVKKPVKPAKGQEAPGTVKPNDSSLERIEKHAEETKSSPVIIE